MANPSFGSFNRASPRRDWPCRASLVNMFFPSGTMSFVISVAGVLIFSGLIAYDTQKIKEQYAQAWGGEAAEKIDVFGALSLYLSFVNLFQFLMMFLGQRR